MKLVKKSPQRNTKLNAIREKTENEAKSIHKLYPTRWNVQGEALEAIVENHNELMELWEWSLDNVKVTEMRVRIIGAQSKMTTFDFLFGCFLGKVILKQTNNLSKRFKVQNCLRQKAKRVAKMLSRPWGKIVMQNRSICFGKGQAIKPARLPRQRKAPNFFGSKTDPNTQHEFQG